MLLVHGTCVEIGGRGVLLQGPSGSGKSDLALRLIDGGAHLVADDQVCLARSDDGVIAEPPPSIAGMMEIRGIGLVQLPFAASVPLRLLVELQPGAEIERLPDSLSETFLDNVFPKIVLDPFTVSAAAKIRFVVCHAIHRADGATGSIMTVS